MAERTDEMLRLRATLEAIAPGTSLRDGLERILRGRTGALIVLAAVLYGSYWLYTNYLS